jgi:hypothetical protein
MGVQEAGNKPSESLEPVENSAPSSQGLAANELAAQPSRH